MTVRLTGMRGFTVVWAGQVVSMLGSGMTQFAITIWAWQLTGQATTLALVGFFTFGPSVVLSPVAGALVDRWSRKLVMALSDLGAGLATIVMLVLYLSGALEVWHLYALGAWTGAFGAFQFPAYAAAIGSMVRKEQYARASGMLSLAESVATIGAPILAGLALAVIGIAGVFAIDIVTFVLALTALAVVPVPTPPASDEGTASRTGLWRESVFGFRYILARPSLLHLQLLYLGINLTATLGMVVSAPMVLARSGNDELALASMQAAIGAGGVVGGLALSIWGGPRRRIYGVLFGMIGSGLLGTVPLGAGRSLAVWLPAAFLTMLFVPIVNGSNQAIWLSKVAPDVQGKVFAARRLIALLASPLAMLAAGPLADVVMEPAMRPGGALATSFGWLVGTGPGAGMGLMVVFSGVAMATLGFVGLLTPSVRDVETRLPDHAGVREPDEGVVASAEVAPSELVPPSAVVPGAAQAPSTDAVVAMSSDRGALSSDARGGVPVDERQDVGDEAL
jgi:MFS transporter, DHA3 family, macrolide efflux protein